MAVWNEPSPYTEYSDLMRRAKQLSVPVKKVAHTKLPKSPN